MKRKQNTNCRVWTPSDGSFVSTSAPIDLKKRELADIPRSNREIETAKLRRQKQVRPL